MNLKDLDKEIELLKEYMDIYVQILPNCVSCGGNRIHKSELPTFEYFKKTYADKRYSLVIPNYKEAKTVLNKNRIESVATQGLGSVDGIGYRYYNYWMGCKFFTSGNLEGDYILNTEGINEVLKKL